VLQNKTREGLQVARALRLEYAGALYHITSRGDRREDIYDDDEDRKIFLKQLSEVCNQFNWQCHAYCLMTNHYHLLIETIEGNLSKGMRQLNGVYSLKYNHRHGRVGHVFQGRYHSILVEMQSYLLELARYVVLNPVRANMVTKPYDWPWSSYRSTIATHITQDPLNSEWILSQFAKNKRLATLRYIKFVEEGIGGKSPLKKVKNQIFLGSDDFVESRLKQINQDRDLTEIPKLQRRHKAQPLVEIEQRYKNRNDAITIAYQGGGYTMKEIGTHFGISYSMVSKIVKHSQFNV
jgi:REP element-mobilizing transposase RayT